MSDEKRKDSLYNKYIKRRHFGDDSSILNEDKTSPQSGSNGSLKYKDHEDAA